jgi:hypothetical protein
MEGVAVARTFRAFGDGKPVEWFKKIDRFVALLTISPVPCSHNIYCGINLI